MANQVPVSNNTTGEQTVICTTPPVQGTLATMATDAADIATAGTEQVNEGKRYEPSDGTGIYSWRNIGGTWAYYPEATADDSGKIPVSAEITSDDSAKPEDRWLDFTCEAGTTAADVLYTSGNVEDYNVHKIENESGFAVRVKVSVDGTNFSSGSVVTKNPASTTGALALTIADTDIGILEGKFKRIRIEQAATGTVAADSVRGGHCWE